MTCHLLGFVSRGNFALFNKCRTPQWPLAIDAPHSESVRVQCRYSPVENVTISDEIALPAAPEHRQKVRRRNAVVDAIELWLLASSTKTIRADAFAI